MILRSLFLSLFSVLLAPCGRAGADDLAAARDIFRREVAKAFAVDAGKITVQPQHPGLPDNPYDALKTGSLFAFRADWKGSDPGPAGFAAADGRVAFARHPGNVKALLLECGVFTENPLQLPEIVKRLAWVHRGAGTLLEGPRHKASLTREGDAVEILWFARKAGNTGSFTWFRVTTRLRKDGECKTTIGKSEPFQP